MKQVSTVEVVARGIPRTEGIAIDSDGYVYGGSPEGQIFRVSPDNQTQPIADVGGKLLGVTIDSQRCLYFCDITHHAVLKVTGDGQVFQFGDPIVFPNFPVFDLDGNLYVSDSGSDFKAPTGAVYRIDPHGKMKLFADGFHLANGLALSADGSLLYVIQSANEDIVRVEIKSDGTAGAREVYASALKGPPDGMAFDCLGNLYVTLQFSNAIAVIDVHGSRSLLVDDPTGETIYSPTNCAFGGPTFDDLYVSSINCNHLCKIRLGVPGQRLYHQF